MKDDIKVVLAAIGMAAMFFLCSCASVANRDQNSISTAQELKPMSMALVVRAVEPIDKYKSDVDYLEMRLSAALAYEQGKGKTNIISAKQWEILCSPDHDLLGRLLKNWKEGKKFSPAYLYEKQAQIGAGWDEILRLEGAKTE